MVCDKSTTVLTLYLSATFIQNNGTHHDNQCDIRSFQPDYEVKLTTSMLIINFINIEYNMAKQVATVCSTGIAVTQYVYVECNFTI